MVALATERKPAWYATRYDAEAQRTQRVSLGTGDFGQTRQRL